MMAGHASPQQTVEEYNKAKLDLVASVEDAWISCWFHGYRQPDLKRLPPRLWEPLRQRLQRIYRDATGEEMATLIIEESHNG